MDSAVNIKNLSITLGQFKALDNINLKLPKEKIIGFIGPSGAGKTTLIRSIVGSIKISTGEITLFGQLAGKPSLRKEVSYMTQELSIYPDLTVKENLKYFVTMAGQPKDQSKQIISSLLKVVDLTDKSNSLVGNLSGGQKQRVSLAVALIGSPKLMVLDEPTVGLDPVLRGNLWELFENLTSQGTTIIISSHSMDEASRCDDLVLIRDSSLIAHETPDEILKSTKSKTIEESFLKLVGDKK